MNTHQWTVELISEAAAQPGVVLVFGRPACGKTNLGLAIALREAKRRERKSRFFSLKMSVEQLESRIACLSGDAGLLSIDDTPAVLVDDLEADLRRTSPGALVVVDYLQLVRWSSPAQDRAVQIAGILERVGDACSDGEHTVIFLAQLSRDYVESPPRTVADLPWALDVGDARAFAMTAETAHRLR